MKYRSIPGIWFLGAGLWLAAVSLALVIDSWGSKGGGEAVVPGAVDGLDAASAKGAVGLRPARIEGQRDAYAAEPSEQESRRLREIPQAASVAELVAAHLDPDAFARLEFQFLESCREQGNTGRFDPAAWYGEPDWAQYTPWERSALRSLIAPKWESPPDLEMQLNIHATRHGLDLDADGLAAHRRVNPGFALDDDTKQALHALDQPLREEIRTYLRSEWMPARRAALTRAYDEGLYANAPLVPFVGGWNIRTPIGTQLSLSMALHSGSWLLSIEVMRGELPEWDRVDDRLKAMVEARWQRLAAFAAGG